jgi:hypothetical protein
LCVLCVKIFPAPISKPACANQSTQAGLALL